MKGSGRGEDSEVSWSRSNKKVVGTVDLAEGDRAVVWVEIGRWPVVEPEVGTSVMALG